MRFPPRVDPVRSEPELSGPSRRAVIIGSAAALGVVAIGGGAVLVRSARSSRSEAARALFSGVESSAETVGRVYVGDAGSDPVLDDPGAGPPGSVPEGTEEPLEWFTSAPTAELAEVSAAGCREDFVGQRTVNLRGWVLPVTAAQLCGLTEVD